MTADPANHGQTFDCRGKRECGMNAGCCPVITTADPAKDAERLARLRVFYEGCGEMDDNQPTGIGHPTFLMRLLNERDGVIDRLREANTALQRYLADEQNNVARLTQERDEARRSAEDLRERVAAADAAVARDLAERKCQREMLGDPRKGLHIPPADWGPPQNATQPSAADVERARDLCHQLGLYGYGHQQVVIATLSAARREERELLPCGHVKANIGDTGLCEACQDIAATRELRALDEAVKPSLRIAVRLLRFLKRKERESTNGRNGEELPWQAAADMLGAIDIDALDALATRDAAIRARAK